MRAKKGGGGDVAASLAAAASSLANSLADCGVDCMVDCVATKLKGTADGVPASLDASLPACLDDSLPASLDTSLALGASGSAASPLRHRIALSEWRLSGSDPGGGDPAPGDCTEAAPTTLLELLRPGDPPNSPGETDLDGTPVARSFLGITPALSSFLVISFSKFKSAAEGA